MAKKRRIYDITNVLEGVNLIEKIEKNLYVWRGRSNDDEQENARLDDMQMEKKELKDEEAQLDKWDTSSDFQPSSWISMWICAQFEIF